MEALELITGRRSVRQFKAEKVDRATVEKIVGAAAYAPSWKNTQVTRYYVCDDAKIKEHIARDCTMGFTYNAGTLERAPPGGGADGGERPQRNGEGRQQHHPAGRKLADV